MAQDTAPPKHPSRPANAPGGKSPNDVQGEGDYEAARRYRKEVQEFLGHSDVEQRARAAAPESAKEERDLALAEEQGKDRSKGDDPVDVGLMYPGRSSDDAQPNDASASKAAKGTKGATGAKGSNSPTQ